MKIGLACCGREYSFPPAFIERVNQLGQPHGITAEMVKFGGTKMDEPAEYRVIVDRISHEVEYYRGALKHAVLQGTLRHQQPVLVDGRRQVFQLLGDGKLGCAIPQTVLLPQKGYPADVDLTPESLRNLGYPIDWDGLLDYVGRPAILKPYSGGGWKHVYKVNDREELLEAYDGTVAVPMTLQQFINFDQYVRCFTFGKTDITPVAYDPRERRYLVEHEYLTAELGARVVRDAQTINLALGYEMNTIEFAVERRRAVRHRLPQPGAGLRARSHHRLLLPPRRREDGGPRHRSGAERRSVRSRGRDGRRCSASARRAASPARPRADANY